MEPDLPRPRMRPPWSLGGVEQSSSRSVVWSASEVALVGATLPTPADIVVSVAPGTSGPESGWQSGKDEHGRSGDHPGAEHAQQASAMSSSYRLARPSQRRRRADHPAAS